MKEFFSTNFQQIKMSNEKTRNSTQTTRTEVSPNWVHEIQDEKEVDIHGFTLTVAQVAAVARRPDVTVVLDAAAAKDRIDGSSEWVLQNMRKATVTYGVNTGFGATSHPRSDHGVDLQRELILKDASNILPASSTRAAKMVRTDTLL
ncbi:hypothetical protein Mapa_007383 [Marchantia paleacea]|nr:hypothetical protein Mapa_007383 [Marchantia paleacea]